MSGGGIGSALGTGLGMMLAPETGGLSMALPAILGAAGGFAGGKIGGDKNPLMDALMGGVGGGLGGASGLGSAIGNVGGVGDSIASSLPDWLGGTAAGAGEAMSPALAAADAAAAPGVGAGAGQAFATDALGQPTQAATDAFANAPLSGVAGGTDSDAATSPLSSIGSWLGKDNHLGQSAYAAGIGLPLIQSMMAPTMKYNVGQNASNVMATNPGFNATLPKYSMQNTGTPYSGDWYKYGMQGNPSMYNAMPQPAARGGMVGYAQGGRVKGYAMGGVPMPQAMPPQAPQMSPQDAPQQPVNPLMLAAAHKIGVALGNHIKKHQMTPPGRVQGAGGGQDDVVPARLSKDEFVVPADVVGHLGDGSSEAGGKKLGQMLHNVRAHKVSKGAGFPPKAKNPLSYVGA